MLARYCSPTVAVCLVGALLGVVGTLAVQRQLDGRDVSHDMRGPVNRSVQLRDESSELAAYVRAFNRRRGITAAAKYGPHSYVFAVCNGFDWDLHLVQWGKRPGGSPPPLGGIFDEPAAVVNEMMATTDKSVNLPCLAAEGLELIDLNDSGRREVVVDLGHSDGFSTAVVDFGQPEGQEVVLWSADSPLVRASTTFIDMDDDGKYEMIQTSTRSWIVTELIEEATKVSDDTGLEGCEDMYLVYRLDSAAAEKERPPWVDRVFKPNDIHVGRDPLRYHLATVTGEDPVGSHD